MAQFSAVCGSKLRIQKLYFPAFNISQPIKDQKQIIFTSKGQILWDT